MTAVPFSTFLVSYPLEIEHKAHTQCAHTHISTKTNHQKAMESWLLIWRLKRISYIQSPDGSVVKNPPANAGDTRDTGSVPGSGRSAYRKWQPTAVILPGKPHGQRSLARYTVQGITKIQTRQSIHTWTLLHLKWIPSRDLLYSTGNLLNIM